MWMADETIPFGWLKRKTKDREYILSPFGKQYMSRVVALTDMLMLGFDLKDIESMRNVLHFEGWTQHELLPKGWFSKAWEGGSRKSKLLRNLYFVTREGARLDSFSAVLEFMENSNYTEGEKENIREFKKLESSIRREKYIWEECESLPPGWKKRKGSGKKLSQTCKQE